MLVNFFGRDTASVRDGVVALLCRVFLLGRLPNGKHARVCGSASVCGPVASWAAGSTTSTLLADLNRWLLVSLPANSREVAVARRATLNVLMTIAFAQYGRHVCTFLLFRVCESDDVGHRLVSLRPAIAPHLA